MFALALAGSGLCLLGSAVSAGSVIFWPASRVIGFWDRSAGSVQATSVPGRGCGAVDCSRRQQSAVMGAVVIHPIGARSTSSELGDHARERGCEHSLVSVGRTPVANCAEVDPDPAA